MDGTLTMPVHDFNAIRNQIGIAENTPILEAILEMPPQEAHRTRCKLHAIEMKIAGQAVPQPGALKLLQRMRKQGFQLGILTRNDEEIAYATLKASGLDHYFALPDVIGRETCPPKPMPDGILHLLARWNASPSKTVMVGDFLYDIDAGRRAGVRTVHFDHSGEFRWPHLADHKVTRLADIAGLIG